MLDQLADQIFIEALIEHQGVPMALVHVITRKDRRVLIAQIDRTLRLAFQIHPRRHVFGRQRGEHLSAHFVDQNLGAEGAAFLGRGLR